MRRYYVSDRNRGKIRTLLTWQATDQLTFQAGVDLNKDAYPGAFYGLQDAKSWAVDLDGTYALGEKTSVNVFYTYDDGRSLMRGQHVHRQQQHERDCQQPAGRRGSLREQL